MFRWNSSEEEKHIPSFGGSNLQSSDELMTRLPLKPNFRYFLNERSEEWSNEQLG